MGGGKVTRPDFGLGQPDPGHPMTEFYTLVLEGLEQAESFALPGLYARFDPPAWPIEAHEARDWCSLSPVPREGFTQIVPPGRLRVLYSELRCTAAGAPSALVLTQEGHPDQLRPAAAAALPLALGGRNPGLARLCHGPDPDVRAPGGGSGRRQSLRSGPPAHRDPRGQSLGAASQAGPLAGSPGRPLAEAVAVIVH